jgi:hypothetical protein
MSEVPKHDQILKFLLDVQESWPMTWPIDGVSQEIPVFRVDRTAQARLLTGLQFDHETTWSCLPETTPPMAFLIVQVNRPSAGRFALGYVDRVDRRWQVDLIARHGTLGITVGSQDDPTGVFVIDVPIEPLRAFLGAIG